MPGSGSRLFFALDPPGSVSDRVSRWQERVGRPALRAVPAGDLHLTLAFLGTRPNSEIPVLSAIARSVPAAPVCAELRPQPVPLPRRRPRLFALELDSADAGALAAELRRRLAAAGIAPADQRPGRPFWPHLTVFRTRGGARVRGRLPSFETRDPDGHGHAFGFVRIALYRSETRSEGSRYSRLAATELPQPAATDKR